ncbi:RNA-guided endonuclease InsQ/TnpB family protein [Allosalinactinospora lopnorensis]|uniref:RNA-guided endonuclease InsQ/TnpB family protein n=1 Tax=Allosalinactinospora lopnorensis TaxID=1352348 RepID=UPI000623C3B5|nr:RNA-guided endonuclease TnpB family protein [Allosalinactinospora lopnorensis]
MQLRYGFRLYPQAGQRTALAKAFGCARVVYNDALRARETARSEGLPFPKTGELSTALITEAKKTPERVWLGEVSAVVLQQSLRDLDAAYKNFFDGLKAKRPRMGAPRFKSKRDTRQSVRFTANARWSITTGGKLRLPKIGDIKVKWSRDLPSEPSSVTVIKDASGRYFASFVVETAKEPLPESAAEVGIDLGLTHFAVLSDGTKIDNPRFLRRAERRLRKAQQALARKAKGANNRKKAVAKVACAHAKVADARRDFVHKLSAQIIRENQAVYVEDLCVKGLARTRLAKSVHDAGWAQFTAMLAYKAARHGRTLGKLDRWFPSSKLCSACGAVAQPMPLNVRKWECPCGALHDRDVNAAVNILAAGRVERLNACGGTVRPAA